MLKDWRNEELLPGNLIFAGNNMIKSPQSTQKAQNFTIPATAYEPVPSSRRGTRMTRIARIFTDRRASAQSAFYWTPSAFICVHLRLIFVSLSDITHKIQFNIFPIINANIFLWAIKKGGKLDERFTVS
jgi:hypothetical protein